LGGFVFGQWLGFVYSTVGLTIGSLGAFWVGRRLGAAFVQGLVAPQVWERMGFLVEPEGAILYYRSRIVAWSERWGQSAQGDGMSELGGHVQEHLGIFVLARG